MVVAMRKEQTFWHLPLSFDAVQLVDLAEDLTHYRIDVDLIF